MITRLHNSEIQSVIKKITPNSVNLLAPSLIRDLEKKCIDIHRPDKNISPKEMTALKNEILGTIEQFDKKRKLPYHNASHTENVYKRSVKLLSKSNLKPAQKQLLKFAALYHDYHHGRHGIPDSNGMLSFEEQSALVADEHAGKLGFTVKQRLQLYGLIIGTTFSNPAIQPRTKLEKLLVIADLGGFTNSSKAWLLESVHVTLEIPPHYRPADISEWLKEQLNFLRYVKKRLTPEARKLNWHLSLDKKNILVRNLLKNPEFNRTFIPIVKKIKQTLTPPLQKLPQ